jgi:hypothetical protein
MARWRSSGCYWTMVPICWRLRSVAQTCLAREKWKPLAGNVHCPLMPWCYFKYSVESSKAKLPVATPPFIYWPAVGHLTTHHCFCSGGAPWTFVRCVAVHVFWRGRLECHWRRQRRGRHVVTHGGCRVPCRLTAPRRCTSLQRKAAPLSCRPCLLLAQARPPPRYRACTGSTALMHWH